VVARSRCKALIAAARDSCLHDLLRDQEVTHRQCRAGGDGCELGDAAGDVAVAVVVERAGDVVVEDEVIGIERRADAELIGCQRRADACEDRRSELDVVDADGEVGNGVDVGRGVQRGVEHEAVRSGAAVQIVVAERAIEVIRAAAAEQVVGGCVADDDVVAETADEALDAGVGIANGSSACVGARRVETDRQVSVVGVIVAGVVDAAIVAADMRVGAKTAIKLVAACVATQVVIAAKTVDEVTAAEAEQVVVRVNIGTASCSETD